MKMQMGFICLVCFMMINIGVTRATICYESWNFTTNSTYEKNRNMILSSLASNVTLRDGFFYTATIGQEPDKVYALALCRGDSLLEECADCVSSSAKDIMRQCLNQKEAVAWGGTSQSIVRYSNRSIFGIMEADPMAGGCEGNNINTTDTAQFNETWVSLMEGLVINASTGSNHPRRKFATGNENFSYFMKIYALLQCTPDISPSDCEDCLRQSIYYREDHDQGQTGCLIMRPSSNSDPTQNPSSHSYLHPNENPTVVLVTPVLNDTNYHS
ncbi:cysteine-rich receptor-like protein kinase 11 [Pistacia vera]|uniref:cysteine-rich receptor-like protein kinase 11 n=1 Tax=Pistacia vera TaxID=55513 RepID=UPI001263CC58|nr:cysteine-rich receptor-like protein kinase 11 [Pistacia vera]